MPAQTKTVRKDARERPPKRARRRIVHGEKAVKAVGFNSHKKAADGVDRISSNI